MRRTYKSKKDMAGAFDPRDGFLGDDKSSAFDAFYIQNIKQTKREMSCTGATNQLTAGNKVRKRKYVRRIGKTIEEPNRDSLGNTSTYLTPDKSIHVKKEMDLFDQLLNSSAPRDDNDPNTKNNLFDQLKLSNRQKKTYSNKVKWAIKKFNYSTSDSDDGSEKENSRENLPNNMTDIQQYKLVVENDPIQTSIQDDSINQLVNNISLINKIKGKQNVNRVTDNILVPDALSSPLCSTPFVEKYRGKSIYNFSPIAAGLDDSVDILTNKSAHDDVAKNESGNDEVVEVKDMINGSGQKSPNELDAAEGTVRINTGKNDNTTQSDSSNTIENSDENNPFFGFSNTTGLDKILHNSLKNVVVNSRSNSPILNTTSKVNKTRHFTAEKRTSHKPKHSIEVKSFDDSSIEISVIQEPCLGFSDSTIAKANAQVISVDSETDNDSISSNEAQTTIMETEPNEESYRAENEINSSEDDYNSVDSDVEEEHTEDSDKESNYDTCDSDDNVINVEHSQKKTKVPLVVMERMDAKLFEKYYSKTQDKTLTVDNADEIPIDKSGDSLANTADVETQDSHNDNSIIGDNESPSSDGEVNEVKKQVSFVTTRRGNMADNSVIMVFDDSNVSSNSSDCDNTVLSNHCTSEATNTNELQNNKEAIEDNLQMHYQEASTSSAVHSNSICKSPGGYSDTRPSIFLHPGKKWERSLSIYRRMTLACDNDSLLEHNSPMKGRKYRESIISTIEMQEKGPLHNESFRSRRKTILQKPSRTSFRILKEPNGSRLSLHTTDNYNDLTGFLTDDCNDTLVELSKLSIADPDGEVTVIDKFDDAPERLTSARDYVLRRCDQTDAVLFDECYPGAILKNCHKIGEGVYGEVFLWRAIDGVRVMKIVPIGGTTEINGEHQKDFQEIISEIVIAMELSALRTQLADIESRLDDTEGVKALDVHSVENATDVFNQVLAVRCVVGNYPSRLLDLWELYDETKGSENENPAILPPDQQYIVLELANAGQDLESYQFNSAEQAHALFLQIAFGLAVAEEAYHFEHRDLHWGNVLIAPTDQKFATFVLRGSVHRVARRGVRATIIDYSLSRLSLPLAGGERVSLYDDLAAHQGLFDATGDYQFELYRLMRDKTSNDWKTFEPYTNILWLHYTVDKMITALRYKRTNTKIHKHYIAKLKGIKNRILDYGSSVQFVLTDNEF